MRLRSLVAVGMIVVTGSAVLLIAMLGNRPAEEPVLPGERSQILLSGELTVPAGMDFVLPLDVATDIDGNIYVADAGSHDIKVFTARGELAYILGGADYFNYPNAVATGPGNLLYVGEFREQRIQVIDTQSREVVAVFDEDSLGQPVEPLSLAVAVNGLVYVGDRSGAVLILTPGGELRQLIDTVSAQPEQLSFPNGVAVDFSGNLLVADSGNARLLLLDNNGSLVREFPGGAMHQPRGVSFVDAETLVAADAFGSQLILLGREFTVLAVLADPGGSKMIPGGIALSGTNLYVADRSGNRVLIFRLRV